MNKHRCYQFTWNNYTEEDIEHLKQVKGVKYCLFGREVGKEGTPHLQGMIVFENPRSWDAVRTRIFKNNHIEVAKSMAALRQYCKKDGDIVEWGQQPEQGRRVDIEDMVEQVQQGAKAKDLWKRNPTLMTQYHRSFERCRYDMLEDRTEAPKVHWFWGGTGTGKTRTAFESSESCYIKDGTKWWDGYFQQESIIIDDFDGQWPYRDLLRLLDRYPYSGQVKGGYVKVNSPNIYITCEHKPDHFWEDTELAQVLRRITEVRIFKRKEAEESEFQ